MLALHLTRDLAPRGVGGLSTAVYGLAQSLAGSGLSGAVASFDEWRPRARPGAPARVAPAVESGLPVLRLSHEGHLPDLFAWAASLRPDVVCVHDALLWSVARRVEARRIYVTHVAQREMSRLRGLTTLTMSAAAEQEALAEADRVIAPSRAAAEALGERRAELRVCPLGVDDTPWAREAAEAGLPEAPVILYVGRLGDVKGTDTLLDVFDALLRERPTLRCVLAGGLPAHGKAERRWRRRWAARAGAHAERLSWAGWLGPEALARAYRGATVVVVPSRFETFGQVPVEAALHGRPVVASAAGALTARVVDEVTGLLVPPGDAPAMVSAVSRLLDDPERARALGREAARQARETSLWPMVTSAWLDALTETP